LAELPSESGNPPGSAEGTEFPGAYHLSLFLSLSSVQEVKEHSFFRGIDWQHVYLQKVWHQGAETTTSAQPARLSLLLSGFDP
jgi:hypothetical protein